MAGPYDTPQTFWDKVRDLFGKPSVTLPTPNVDDYIVVQTETKGGDTPWKLPYGTQHSTLVDKTGAPLVLVKQSRSPGTQEGQFVVTRMYVNNRINQGSYNYSLSWALNSKAHIIVSRSSLVLRSVYLTTTTTGGVTTTTVNATPNFTPDATFPTALLVSETAAPAEAPYDTLYLRVTQTFETIPGPVLSGQEFTKIGRTVTLIPPEFLGNQQLFLSSQVVLPGTMADPQDSIDTSGHIVVSSIVTAIDATHSQKVNIARANVAYPTLLNAELESDYGGAVATTSRSIVAAGTAPTDGYLVIGSSEKAIDGTDTLQEQTTVTGFPELVGAEFSSSIPDKFLQGFTLEEDTDWPDTTTTPATAQLTTGPLVISCKITAEKPTRGKRVTRRLPTGAVLPTFTSNARNSRGQYVTTVESITDGTTPLPTLTALYTDPTSQVPLGGGNFLRTISTVSDVFAETEYAVEVPNVIPEEFRALALTDTVGSNSAGAASTPTLGTGDLRKTVRQVDEQTIRTETTTLNLAALPVTLTSTRTNGAGQIETVARTLQLASATVPTPDALTRVSTQNLGNGIVVVEVVTIPAVFTEAEYTSQLPDLIPEEFRALVTTLTVGMTVTGIAAQPTLAAGQLRATQRQVNAFTLRQEIETLNIGSLPVTITGSRTDADGQVETVARTLSLDTATPPIPTAVVRVTFTKLGNGLAVQEVVTKPGVFARPEYTTQIPDPAPEWVKVLAPTQVVSYRAPGTASQPTLETGEFRVTMRQVDEFVVEVETESRNLASLPVTLIDTHSNEKGQLVTRTRNYASGGQEFTPTAFLSGGVEDLGDGYTVLTTETLPDVFAHAVFSAERPDTTPEWARALLPDTTASDIYQGTASAPTLGTGDISARQEQLTEQTYRLTVTTRPAAMLPVSVQDQQIVEGGLLGTRTRTLSATAPTLTPDTTGLTISNELVALGDGRYVQTIVTVIAYPALSGQKFDPELGIAVPYTEQTVSATAATGLIGAANTDIIPTTPLLSRTRVTPPPTDAILNAFYRYYPAKGRAEFPDVLEGIDVTWENANGTGSSNEVGTSVESGYGTISLNTPNSSQASVTLMPEIMPIFAPNPSSEILPMDDYLFFAPVNSTLAAILTKLGSVIATQNSLGEAPTVADWPVFARQVHTFILKGQKATVRATATARISSSIGPSGSSAASSSGESSDQDFSSTIRAVTTRASIHGAIDLTQGGTVQTSMTDTVAAAATATITGPSSANATSSQSLAAAASVTPASLTATPGLTALPTSGLYANTIDVVASSFTGWNRVRVRVFNFSNLPMITG